MTKDRLSGIIVLLTGIIWLLLTTQVKANVYSSAIGPDFFPGLASFGLVLCGIGLIVRKPIGANRPFCTKEGWIRVLKISVAIILYPFVLDYLGFIVSAVYFIFTTATLFDLEKKFRLINRIMFSVILSVLVYIFFSYVLDIILPVGKLIELFIG